MPRGVTDIPLITRGRNTPLESSSLSYRTLTIQPLAVVPLAFSEFDGESPGPKGEGE